VSGCVPRSSACQGSGALATPRRITACTHTGPARMHTGTPPATQHTCILLRAAVRGSFDTWPAVTQGCRMHWSALSRRLGSTTSSLRTRSLALHECSE
jgi:hypothetical protein